MINLACKQTARAALKLKKLGDDCLTDEQLANVHQLLDVIAEKVEDLHCYSSAAEKFTEFSPKPSSLYQPFRGFDLLYDTRSTDVYSGYETEAPPEMYVNLIDPSSPPSSFKEAVELIQTTVVRCSKLRSKISVSSSSLVMYQAYSIVEHLVVCFLPLPSPDPKGANDIWRNARITRQEQQACLSAIYLLSQHFLTSSFSLTQDSVLRSARILVQLALFAIFDVVIRLIPTDGPSPVTLALHGYDPYVDFSPKMPGESLPFFPDINSMHSSGLNDIAAHMVIVEPGLLILRDKVLAYWKPVVCFITSVQFAQ
jgi:hypothetical protein